MKSWVLPPVPARICGFRSDRSFFAWCGAADSISAMPILSYGHAVGGPRTSTSCVRIKSWVCHPYLKACVIHMLSFFCYDPFTAFAAFSCRTIALIWIKLFVFFYDVQKCLVFISRCHYDRHISALRTCIHYQVRNVYKLLIKMRRRPDVRTAEEY